MTLPWLESRITVPTGGWTMAITEVPAAGPANATIPAGDYYLSGATGLLQTLEDALNAATPTVGTYDVTMGPSSGQVTISASGITSFTATWTHTALRACLGYTADLTAGALSYFAPNQVLRAWFPNTDRMPSTPNPASVSASFGRQEYDYTVSVSPSGAMARAVFETRYVDSLEFRNIKGYNAWTAHESTVNESFQTFMQYVMDDGGTPIRYYPDTNSSATYWELVLEDAQELRLAPVVQGWVGSESLWNVGPYKVRKKV